MINSLAGSVSKPPAPVGLVDLQVAVYNLFEDLDLTVRFTDRSFSFGACRLAALTFSASLTGVFFEHLSVRSLNIYKYLIGPQSLATSIHRKIIDELLVRVPTSTVNDVYWLRGLRIVRMFVNV